MKRFCYFNHFIGLIRFCRSPKYINRWTAQLCLFLVVPFCFQFNPLIFYRVVIIFPFHNSELSLVTHANTIHSWKLTQSKSLAHISQMYDDRVSVWMLYLQWNIRNHFKSITNTWHFTLFNVPKTQHEIASKVIFRRVRSYFFFFIFMWNPKNQLCLLFSMKISHLVLHSVCTQYDALNFNCAELIICSFCLKHMYNFSKWNIRKSVRIEGINCYSLSLPYNDDCSTGTLDFVLRKIYGLLFDFDKYNWRAVNI